MSNKAPKSARKPSTPHRRRVGRIQQKILLMLMTGVALGLSGSPNRYFKILKAFKKDWDLLNSPQFSRSIESLAKQGLIICEQKHDGTLIVELTEKGRLQAMLMPESLPHIVDKKNWDGIWHVVMFDISTSKNNTRDSFRLHLKRLGFVELQRSVFVSPYDAREVVDTLSALNDVFDGVVYMEVSSISNERKLKKHFKL
jgi:hypothetical protein